MEEFHSLQRSTYPKKSKSIQKKNQHELIYPKSANSANSQETAERSLQRRDADNLVKKIVSPIKEEANNNSVDNTYEISCALNPFSSPVHHLSNKAYIDAHEEDSLRDLQDLPQDQVQSPSHFANEIDNNIVSNTLLIDVDDSRSPVHGNDNPDSLEANDISSDSKDDIDASVSAEGKWNLIFCIRVEKFSYLYQKCIKNWY